MSSETILTLGSLVIPVGAGRGITQTIKPISNGALRRTVNGTLKDLTRIENRKFESQIRCTDMATPSMAELWKGNQITVGCIQTLNQLVNPEASSTTLIRDPVSGSVVGFKADGSKLTPTSVVGRVATFASNIERVEFRPSLTMLVVATSFDVDEYAAEEGWSIDLEEA